MTGWIDSFEHARPSGRVVPPFVVTPPRGGWGCRATAANADRTDDGRAALEAQRNELTAGIKRLIAVATGGDPRPLERDGPIGVLDVPEVTDAIRKLEQQRYLIKQRPEALAEPIDRGALKATLEQRVGPRWRPSASSRSPSPTSS